MADHGPPCARIEITGKTARNVVIDNAWRA
jgi:hypothetical protein